MAARFNPWQMGTEIYKSTHPLDSYAALYYPNYFSELPHLKPRERRLRRELAYEDDIANLLPEAPPDYDEAELSVLRQWRTKALAIVQARIARFQHFEESESALVEGVSSNRNTSRALYIAEILEATLRLAGPGSILAACNVSKHWRSTALYIIRSRNTGRSFWESYPCLPVEYGQRQEMAWLKPTPEDIAEFRTTFFEISRRRRRRFPEKYFPARLSQSPNLPDDLVQALDHMDNHQNAFQFQQPPPQPMPRSRPEIYWLDFSQMRINPFFGALFDDRISIRSGRCEIALRPSDKSLGMLLEPFASSLPLAAIGNMFVTQPPCKTIGIYRINPYKDWRSVAGEQSLTNLDFLYRVHDDEGIRIKPLVQALQRHSHSTLSLWLWQAGKLKYDVESSHWIDDVWNIPSVPKLVLLLDNNRMLWGADPYWHITRDAYMGSVGFRDERQGEWMPVDMIEPAKASTIRSQLDWNI